MKALPFKVDRNVLDYIISTVLSKNEKPVAFMLKKQTLKVKKDIIYSSGCNWNRMRLGKDFHHKVVFNYTQMLDQYHLCMKRENMQSLKILQIMNGKWSLSFYIK